MALEVNYRPQSAARCQAKISPERKRLLWRKLRWCWQKMFSKLGARTPGAASAASATSSSSTAASSKSSAKWRPFALHARDLVVVVTPLPLVSLAVPVCDGETQHDTHLPLTRMKHKRVRWEKWAEEAGLVHTHDGQFDVLLCWLMFNWPIQKARSKNDLNLIS